MTDLLSRLRTDPSEPDVLEYLAQRAEWAAEHEIVASPIPWFWQPGDLDHYRAAAAWWPGDAPGMLALPPIDMLLDGLAMAWPLEPETFYQRLLAAAARVTAWLEREGRDPASPNESPEDRRRRLGREAVARHRALSRSTDPRAAHVRRLYEDYMDLCAQRRAAAAAFDEPVAAAKAVWEEARLELLAQGAPG